MPSRSGGKCDYPVCEGSHYKYDDCWTEALASAMDWADETTGSVEWSVYAELHMFPESAQIKREDSGMAFDVFFVAGTHFIVKHNDQGFVWSEAYTTKRECERAWARINREYGIWLDKEES